MEANERKRDAERAEDKELRKAELEQQNTERAADKALRNAEQEENKSSFDKLDTTFLRITVILEQQERRNQCVIF